MNETVYLLRVHNDAEKAKAAWNPILLYFTSLTFLQPP